MACAVRTKVREQELNTCARASCGLPQECSWLAGGASLAIDCGSESSNGDGGSSSESSTGAATAASIASTGASTTSKASGGPSPVSAMMNVVVALLALAGAGIVADVGEIIEEAN